MNMNMNMGWEIDTIDLVLFFLDMVLIQILIIEFGYGFYSSLTQPYTFYPALKFKQKIKRK